MPPKLVSRRRQARRDPAAGLRARARPRALRRGDGISRSFPARCAARRRTCSASRSAAMLREWEKQYPGRVENMFNALPNVVPSHLLDRQLQDFAAVRATRHRRCPTATSRSTTIPASMQALGSAALLAGRLTHRPRPPTSPSIDERYAVAIPARTNGDPSLRRCCAHCSLRLLSRAGPPPESLAGRRCSRRACAPAGTDPLFPPHLDRFRSERRRR